MSERSSDLPGSGGGLTQVRRDTSGYTSDIGCQRKVETLSGGGIARPRSSEGVRSEDAVDQCAQQNEAEQARMILLQ